MKRTRKGKIDSIEKLAQIVADGFADIDEHFHKVDQRFLSIDRRFVSLESEVRNGFQETRALLNRIDTRLAALELVVFGGSNSANGRVTVDSLLSRLHKLEKVVFKK